MDIFVGIVLLNQDQSIYLIKEDDVNQIGRDRWNLPGGRVETKDGLIEAIIRETVEETGYHATVKSLVGLYKAKVKAQSWLYVVFDGLVTEHEQEEWVDPAVKEGRWFKAEEFHQIDNDQLVHPDMKLVYEIAVKKQGLGLDSIKAIQY